MRELRDRPTPLQRLQPMPAALTSARSSSLSSGRIESVTSPGASFPPQFDPPADRARRSTRAGWHAGLFTAEPSRSDARRRRPRRRTSIVMPPPERDGGAAHGARAQQHRAGRPRPLAPHERRRGALGPGHRPRRHRDAERRREACSPRKGKTRYDVGRDAFVQRTRAIRRRNRRRDPRAAARDRRVVPTGRAPRTRCRPELSRAVREAFVRLYERGLIYRGHRVIHWCPRCLTSLSRRGGRAPRDDGQALSHRVPARRGRRRDRGGDRRSRRRVRRRCSATSPWP